MEENNKRQQQGQQLEVTNYLSKGNQFVLYLYKRISKVSQAIYIITDIIKDAEPLKWALRNSATDMVSLRQFLDEHNVFNNLERILLELEGLLDFARNTRVLSTMNSEVIQDQIKKIINEMKEGALSRYGNELAYPFFEVAKPEPLSPSNMLAPYHNKGADKSHKGHSVLYDFYHKQGARKDRSIQTINSTSGTKNDRRHDMLTIIKSKGAVTIKDITDQIKDCSEKTVQRELTMMVLEGVIKKTGERRWSRYSMSTV